MSNMLGKAVFIIIGVIMIAYAIMILRLPFIYKKDIKARYLSYKKTNKGYFLYFSDGKKQYQTRYAFNKADMDKYLKEPLREIYASKDQCLLNPAYYFIRGLIALGVGVMIIAMAIFTF